MNEGFGVLLQIVLRIGGLAFVAVGGANVLIPALHETVVADTHWLGEPAFAESIALAQAAPGPNMLLIPLIGWNVAGIAGALVALVAFVVPSTTIAVVGARFIERHEHRPAIVAFKWALRPVTVGLMVATTLVVVATAAHALPVPSARGTLGLVAVMLAVAVCASRSKLNPLVWLAGAALIGAFA